jgi:hypothetical protein
MAMPAHLEEWWRQHPERWSQRHRHYRGFPADGPLNKQIDWFRRQFLKLADKASTTKERGEFLKLAFMATLKGEGTGASDEARYRDYLVEQELEARLAGAAERRRQALQPPPPI